MSLPIAWALDIAGRGDAYGYTMVSRSLKAALESRGVVWDTAAPTVLHVCPPHVFEPVPGRRNIWMTMWECERIDAADIAATRRAHLLLVPCDANRTWLRWSGVRCPIRVVPLGLDPAHLTAAATSPPARPMRALWCGAPSLRKGWDVLARAFGLAFPDAGRGQDVELVVKSTTTGAPFRWEQPGVRIIVEDYSVEALADLYRSAHIFAFPTRGEGFGLTVLEAMAAGCLVLAPAIAGLAEFFDGRVGWPLPWRRAEARYGEVQSVPEVPAPALAGALRRAVLDYPTTGALRARARARAQAFTWDAAAARVLHALATAA